MTVAAPPRSDARDWVGLVARLLLGGVLLVAGLLKITALGTSRTATRAYDLMPVDVANFIGTLLPMLEIVLGVLIIAGLLTRGAARLGGLLMLAFIGGITSAWARGLTIDCGCFGGGGSVGENQTKYLQEILRDAGLALCAAWLVVRPQSRWSLDRRWWG
ncbi:DoxX family membrane protein [Luteipulveratus sp. YIM 133132]|uniref:MauE/DoxX family redox-associated membrane protein n=1 Tax=Luteipulveratus flavus TaxID=3031728 RepID=UPI0023AFD32B|nr:MauE/DoxX family redox-associated membrane protein [Luteipulveratus sp. YIM 133132]MDE9366011.1 DoxX family membrane protein [Luteipulveratus sp. YIM 133132]